MKKHKTRIVAALCVVVVLAAAFWWGGNAGNLHGWGISPKQETARTTESKPKNRLKTLTEKEAVTQKVETSSIEQNQLVSQPEPQNPPDGTIKETVSPQSALAENGIPLVQKKTAVNMPPAQKTEVIQKTEPTDNRKTLPEQVPPTEQSAANPAQTLQQTAATKSKNTVIISVRCDSVLANIKLLDSEKKQIIPSDGMILPPTAVTFEAGESAFDLLVRVLKEKKIHLEFNNVPLYKSAYIEGIGNLYEFDCGELSGWMYRVNGVFPNYGVSRCILKEGDQIDWLYTCDLGKDIGGRNNYS